MGEENEPEEQWDSSYAICPYCLYKKYVESEDYNSDEREQECPECGKTYMQYEEFSVTHYTRPMLLKTEDQVRKG